MLLNGDETRFFKYRLFVRRQDLVAETDCTKINTYRSMMQGETIQPSHLSQHNKSNTGVPGLEMYEYDFEVSIKKSKADSEFVKDDWQRGTHPPPVRVYLCSFIKTGEGQCVGNGHMFYAGNGTGPNPNRIEKRDRSKKSTWDRTMPETTNQPRRYYDAILEATAPTHDATSARIVSLNSSVV